MCDGEEKGALNSCSVAKEGTGLVIACGSNSFALCSGEVFDDIEETSCKATTPTCSETNLSVCSETECDDLGSDYEWDGSVCKATT
jgi:hypothetical protein